MNEERNNKHLKLRIVAGLLVLGFIVDFASLFVPGWLKVITRYDESYVGLMPYTYLDPLAKSAQIWFRIATCLSIISCGSYGSVVVVVLMTIRVSRREGDSPKVHLCYKVIFQRTIISFVIGAVAFILIATLCTKPSEKGTTIQLAYGAYMLISSVVLTLIGTGFSFFTNRQNISAAS